MQLFEVMPSRLQDPLADKFLWDIGNQLVMTHMKLAGECPREQYMVELAGPEKGSKDELLPTKAGLGECVT
jgi:hypothetical protein